MSQIQGRRILITGAAGGMGRLMAQRFGEEGAIPILADVDESRLQQVGASVPGAETHVCDVADREQVEALRERVSPVDVLVNNAGVIATGSYGAVAPADDGRMLTVNVHGVHWMTKAFLPDLIASDEGHLVMMASVAALVGVPYQALYSASKWFVAGLGESVRQELQVEGHGHVGVTIVCPSIVDTGFFEDPHPPHLIPILNPARVVDRVIAAVRNDRPYVREPFVVKLAPLLRSILPVRAGDALSRLLGVSRVVPPAPR